MHETSVAIKVVAAAAEEAGRRGLHRVLAFHLRLGALWGVEPAPLAFHVALLAQRTVLEGARLTVETVPTLARCGSCGGEVKDPRLNDPGFLHSLAHGPILLEALLRCTRCGDGAVAIEQGRELAVAEMEG